VNVEPGTTRLPPSALELSARLEPRIFVNIVPRRALNWNGLTVFINPETGDALANHSDHAVWMGEMLKLNLVLFT
jgi:aromatic ring-cleaving dioxygenase